MKRREFLSGLVLGLAAAGPSLAEGVVDSIIRQLRRQGFRSVVEERTLLGRVRIYAERKDGSREIIVNPRTGEILRDLWLPIAGGDGHVEIIRGGSGSGSNSGPGGGGDHDDDDDDDDDSGSGSSGGGSGGDDGDDDED